MAIIAVIGAVISTIVSYSQQHNEFEQQKELQQISQQFQSEREDIAWERSRPGQEYSDLLGLGFNPNLAAQAVLGGASEVASTSGSPSAPTVNSGLGALSSMFNTTQSNLIDSFMKEAQIENLRSNTNKTDIESGILPRDFALRQLSVTEQLKVWDKSVEKMSSEIGYNKELTDLVKQQNLYYGRLSEAEIRARESQVMQAISQAQLNLEKINTEQKSQDVMDADIALKRAETSNVFQDTANKIIEGEFTYNRSERERIAKEFESSIGGVPLTADAQKMVNKWASEGDYDRIKEFYQTVFQSSLNQTLGSAYGTPAKKGWKLPLNLWSRESYDFSSWANPLNAPIWNPYLDSSTYRP